MCGYGCVSPWIDPGWRPTLQFRRVDRSADRQHRADSSGMDLVTFVLTALPRPAGAGARGRLRGRRPGARDRRGRLAASWRSIRRHQPGPIFRRTKLEDVRGGGHRSTRRWRACLRFITSRSVDLDDSNAFAGTCSSRADGLDASRSLAADLVDEATASWYGRQQGEMSVESVLTEWRAEHDGRTGYTEDAPCAR